MNGEGLPAPVGAPWYLQAPVAGADDGYAASIRQAERAHLDMLRRRGWIWLLFFLPMSVSYGVRLVLGGRLLQGMTLVVANLAWSVTAMLLLAYVVVPAQLALQRAEDQLQAHALQQAEQQAPQQPVASTTMPVQVVGPPSARIDYAALRPDIRAWATRAGVIVRSVQCPGRVHVRVGGTFDCTLTKASGVVVTIVDTLAKRDGRVTWNAAS